MIELALTYAAGILVGGLMILAWLFRSVRPRRLQVVRRES
jgi:hypothetical protein